MRMELDDLPLRYRAQAEAQIAAGKVKRMTPTKQTLKEAAVSAGKMGKAFGSWGEYNFFVAEVLPKMQRGQIVAATPHVAFALLPEKVFCGIRLPAARYTCDYVLDYADGSREVVEIKSKFTRRMQRDYIYRRRLFVDLVAEPKGWKFTEIITPDSKDEIKQWKELTERSRAACLR